jgi:hypothetical protein
MRRFFAAALLWSLAASAYAQAPGFSLNHHAVTPIAVVRSQSGSLPDGTPYRMDVPANWNGVALFDLDYFTRDDEAEKAEARQQADASFGP